MEEAHNAGLIVQSRAGSVPRYKRHLDEQMGKAIGDIWDDIPPVNSQAQERLGYPTQKPVALLERIIAASSNEGDIVLDPFCGCGTTIHAARSSSVMDRHRRHPSRHRAHRAAHERGVSGHRLRGPRRAEGRRRRARLGPPRQARIPEWIVATIGGQPYKGGRKGMDRGIDGYLHFRDADNKPQLAVISVKGGGTNSAHIRDLKGRWSARARRSESSSP